MLSQETKIINLIQFLRKSRPDLIHDMDKADHNYSVEYPSPFHSEGSVLQHVIMVMLEASKANVSPMAAIACLVHDLGKPMARAVNEEKKRISFIGHDGSSCYVMPQLLMELGLTDKEIELMTVVVAKHQYLYEFFKEEVISEKNIQKIADKFTNYKEAFLILLELAHCDNEGRLSSSKRVDIGSYFLPVADRIKTKAPVVNKPYEIKILIGPQASGKSSYASTQIGYTIISRDDSAVEFWKKTYSELTTDEIFDPAVDTLFNSKLTQAIKDRQNILVDKTNMTNKSQNRSLGQLPSEYKKTAVVFLKDYEQLKLDLLDRELKTGKHISEYSLRKTVLNFQCPMYDKFDQIEYKITRKGDIS